MTDEQISRIYLLYEALWPRETNLLQLLPKHDGIARAVYTGLIHPATITEFALGASLYFGELLIEHPFLHAGTVNKKFSPVENPSAYRQEFLKTIIFFFNVMPLVRAGLVNLIPDPCSFDMHLRDQMFHMAKLRSAGIETDPSREPRFERIMKQDFQRGFMSLPRDALRSQLKASLKLDGAELEKTLQGIERLKEYDPLAVLQEGSFSGETGGQLNLMKLAPNFEMAMYVAQATGSCIVTDSLFRWEEIRRAIFQRSKGATSYLSTLAHSIESSIFAFPQDDADIETLVLKGIFNTYHSLMRDIFKYLLKLGDHEPKPNWEAHLAARFARTHSSAQAAVRRARIPIKEARISCVFPSGGIQDNTVNRLLLMSSSERHLQRVPMAFFIEGQASRENQ